MHPLILDFFSGKRRMMNPSIVLMTQCVSSAISLNLQTYLHVSNALGIYTRLTDSPFLTHCASQYSTLPTGCLSSLRPPQPTGCLGHFRDILRVQMSTCTSIPAALVSSSQRLSQASGRQMLQMLALPTALRPLCTRAGAKPVHSKLFREF